MRLRRHQQEHHGDSHGIDLAPMLDFVLNLLIFFIITAVFVKEAGLMVNRPSGAASQPGGAQSTPVHVLANGEVWVDGRAVDVRAVRPNIERLYATNPKGGILIIADREAETGLVVQVIDQIRLGGIQNITFSTN